MAKAKLTVSRSVGGVLSINFDEHHLPPNFQNTKVAFAGPTQIEDGSLILILTRTKTVKAPKFTPDPKFPNRLIGRFSVKHNPAWLRIPAFGVVECEFDHTASRIEITIPAERPVPIYKNQYRDQNPKLQQKAAMASLPAPDMLQSSYDVRVLAAPKDARPEIFAAIDLVNELKSSTDRLFISEDGKLGVELITRYGG